MHLNLAQVISFTGPMTASDSDLCNDFFSKSGSAILFDTIVFSSLGLLVQRHQVAQLLLWAIMTKESTSEVQIESYLQPVLFL